MIMKRLGFGLMLASPVPLISSCVLFGLLSSRSADTNKALTLPIDVGDETNTEVIKVSTQRYCQVAVDLTARSQRTKAYEKTDPTAQKKVKRYSLQYRFPFQYKVSDAEGTIIHKESTEVVWDEGSRSGGNEVPSEEGGTVTVTHKYATFQVDEPGEIEVTCEIKPDAEFGAMIESAQLVVYDNVPKDDAAVLAMMALFGLSPALLLAGVILLVAGNSYLRPAPAQLGESSAVRQVPSIGVLMIVQGALEVFSALPMLLFGSMVSGVFSGLLRKPDDQGQGIDPFLALLFSMPLLMGVLLVIPPILRVCAGVLNMQYRGRILGMVALVPGLITIGSCLGVITGLTSIGLLVYGMIIYLHRDAAQAFRLRRHGYTVDQIKATPGGRGDLPEPTTYLAP